VTATTSGRLGVDAFQALFDRCSNWGRWGPDDERGTLNLITPEKRVQAAGLVREGATVSISHAIHILSLVAMGMQLLDNQNLDDLAVACAERSCWAFMLVIAPLKLVGGTASMTNPIAIF
jgi:hypothetical protein